MKHLLDTNICIHFFRGRFNLIDKFEEVGLFIPQTLHRISAGGTKCLKTNGYQYAGKREKAFWLG